jgi:uracil-DNA glycosylase
LGAFTGREALNDPTLLIEELLKKIRSCRACQQKGYIPEARPVFSPVYPSSWMLIGQAPGKVEQESGLPFMGRAGRNLFRWFKEIGWEERDFRRSVYMTSLTRCWPGKQARTSGDRAPSRKEIDLCLPFLMEEIELGSPRVVILVGKLAVKVFLNIDKLEDAVGEKFAQKGRIWIPLPHPSGASRWLNPEENKARLREALRIIKELGDAGN